MNTNITDAMKIFFEKLNIDPIEFNYYEKENEFVSKEAYFDDDLDLIGNNIVVKISGDVGTVVTGYSVDGIDFTETKTLGQIMLKDGIWVSV